jgi:hypothetical protein
MPASGSYAKALAALEGILADPEASGDHAAAQAARGEIEISIAARVTRAGWLLDHGYPLEAQALYDSLAKGLKGDTRAGRGPWRAWLSASLPRRAWRKLARRKGARQGREEGLRRRTRARRRRSPSRRSPPATPATQVAARAKELAAIAR